MSLRFESTVDGPTLLEVAAMEFAKDLGRAEKHVRIFSGECHAGLYSHELVVEEFRKAHKNKVVVDIIASPVLSMLVDDYKKYSGILDLHREGVIKLYRRASRGEECHYRIIDESLLRVEGSHRSLEELALRNSEAIISTTKIRKCIQKFDNCIKNSQPTSDPPSDFLLLSPQEIESIKLRCPSEYSGREFSSLTYDEIANIADKLRKLWDRDSEYWLSYFEKAKVQMDKAFANV